MLNQTSGQCQKCPIGYYLKNCSKECSPPSYGENCQSICTCPNEDCHFATGCLQHMDTVASYRLSSTTRRDTAQNAISLTVSYSVEGHYNASISYSHGVTKQTSLPTDINLLNNEYLVHVVHVIIGLIAIIVIFFVIFVMTYVYIKCFRKTTDAGQVTNKDLQAHYKSLSFGTDAQKSEERPELQEQFNSECTYLTPVIRCSYNSDTSLSVKNDEIIQELPLNRQIICDETTNASYLTPVEVSPNVYIEITQDSTERNVDQDDV